jgi:hypothetical protein
MVRPGSLVSQPSHSTTPSIASASSAGSVFFVPAYVKVEDASYISLEAANAIVASYPPPETTRNVISKDINVSEPALRTVNMFLDYILHEFLARAKSTSLVRLRGAVALVIRTTLGTAAMVEAEQELAAYLHDSDTELYADGDESDDDAQDSALTWNLEKVWVRARSKCMIYSTLGDKEEDDFDEEPEDEADYDLPQSKRKLSPAGAIYLTSILEFIGEHCFLVAVRTAYQRVGNSLGNTEDHKEPVPLNIQETDVKRGIVEDDLTTRVWRRWKRSEKFVSTVAAPESSQYTSSQASNGRSFTRLPFTPAQASKELDTRNSLPEMSRRRNSADSDRVKTYSLPSSSPTKSSRHRNSKDKDVPIRQSSSLINIKETLGERGIVLPDSPRSSRDGNFEDSTTHSTSPPDSRQRRRSSLMSDDSMGESSRPVSSRGKEILPIRTSEGSLYQDALTTPGIAPVCPDEHATTEDPDKTPTPTHTAEFFQPPPEVVEDKVEEDVYVMGGTGGLDVLPL